MTDTAVVAIPPDGRTRAFAELCATIEDIGGPGVDGGAIAGLYVAARIARFDGRSYAIRPSAFLERTAILRAQAMVTRIDAHTATTA